MTRVWKYTKFKPKVGKKEWRLESQQVQGELYYFLNSSSKVSGIDKVSSDSTSGRNFLCETWTTIAELNVTGKEKRSTQNITRPPRMSVEYVEKRILDHG